MSRISDMTVATLPLGPSDNIEIQSGSSNLRTPATSLRYTTEAVIAGRYFDVHNGLSIWGTSTAVPSANLLYLSPWRGFEDRLNAVAMAMRIVTGGTAATAAMKFGIWQIDPATGKPFGFPVAYNDTEVLADTTGSTIEQAIAGTGWKHKFGRSYAYGWVSKTAAAQPAPACYSNTSMLPRQIMQGDAVPNSAGGTQLGWSIAHTFTDTLNRDLTGQTFTSVSGHLPMFYLKAG